MSDIRGIFRPAPTVRGVPTAASSVPIPVEMDETGRVRTSPVSRNGSVIINVGGGDQTLASPAYAIYVGGAGNMACRLIGDTTDRTFTGLLVGVIYYLPVSIIRQTLTTATLMIALL